MRANARHSARSPGALHEDTPIYTWDHVDALFLGGTTEWKLGPAAADLAAQARRRGLWVHMGRVNSLRRLHHAVRVGCHSVDGTHLAYGPDRKLPELLRWLTAVNEPLSPPERHPSE